MQKVLPLIFALLALSARCAADATLAYGGNVTLVTVGNGTVLSTQNWQGIYGNISGAYPFNASPQVLANGSNVTAINFGYPLSSGFILVTNSSSAPHVSAFTAGSLAYLDLITGTGNDSATNTFVSTSSFNFLSATVANVPTTWPFVNNFSQASSFREGFLQEGSTLVFAGVYCASCTAFDGSAANYELILPTPLAGSMTYYIWFVDTSPPSPSPQGGAGAPCTSAACASDANCSYSWYCSNGCCNYCVTAPDGVCPACAARLGLVDPDCPAAAPSIPIAPSPSPSLQPSASPSPSPSVTPTPRPKAEEVLRFVNATYLYGGNESSLVVTRVVKVMREGGRVFTEVTLTIENRGTADAENVLLREEVPVPLGEVSWREPFPSEFSGNAAAWLFPLIRAGGRAVVSYSFESAYYGDFSKPLLAVGAAVAQPYDDWAWAFVLLLSLLALSCGCGGKGNEEKPVSAYYYR